MGSGADVESQVCTAHSKNVVAFGVSFKLRRCFGSNASYGKHSFSLWSGAYTSTAHPVCVSSVLRAVFWFAP